MIALASPDDVRRLWDGSPGSASPDQSGRLRVEPTYLGREGVEWDNSFGFALHYMQVRHYAAALGRFLQPDPSESEAHAYAYVGSNPVSDSDAAGLCGARTCNKDSGGGWRTRVYASQCTTWGRIWSDTAFRNCVVARVLEYYRNERKWDVYFDWGVDLLVFILTKGRGKKGKPYEGLPPGLKRAHDRRRVQHAVRYFYTWQYGVGPAARMCIPDRVRCTLIVGVAGAAFLALQHRLDEERVNELR